MAKQQQNYLPLVRDNAPLSGILVALKSGKIKTLADLNGKTIAFPSPNSLGASLYMRALLTDKMHIKFTTVYVGSHQNVYRQVLLGDAAAGGGVLTTFQKEPESLQSELSVLFSAPDIASHPLAAHPRVTAEARKKIVAAIFAIRDDPTANKLLAAVQLPQPVEADFDRDYAELAQLRLDRYYIKQAK
jgi:phosphonate transport system substrate-binding protein